MKRGRKNSENKNSSLQEIGEESKKQKIADEESTKISESPDWGNLLPDVILQVFQYLPLLDRAHASQVCRRWNQVFHMPDLWRCFEFELNQPATSYLRATHPELIKQIIKRHSNHLQYVSFKVDSSKESAEAACDILSQLVNCSLKTLGLISTARPSFMDLPKSHFISALTVVFVNSKSLSSLKIDDTPVDDPSLKVLVANNSDTLKLLKMSSCPHVSPAGILCVADQCHGLRELALNYYLLSDELLLALSSEKHVRLEHLRIDVVSENPGQTHFHTIQKSSWDAFIKHSPKHFSFTLRNHGESTMQTEQEAILVKIFAPNIEQMHVVDHFRGSPTEEKRNVLVESARLARGNIQDLADLEVAGFDAVIFPGGFGVAKNLCSWAVDGKNCTVNELVKTTLQAFHSAKKPIGLCCISPVLAAKIFPGCEVTVGHDKNIDGRFPDAETASAIAELGCKHICKDVTESHVDTTNKIVTTCAFMCKAPLHEIFDGIGTMVTEVLKIS